MTNVSATAAARAAAPSPRLPTLPPLPRPRVFFCPISNAAAASTRHALRAAMERAFGGCDADGAWGWKPAYDACEAAQVLFLRKFGPAIRAQAASPAAALPCSASSRAFCPRIPAAPRRARRSSNSRRRSRSASSASTAAAITPADLVLEPSAGTGLLAIFAEMAGASLVLNELAETRAALLDQLFPGVAVTRFDAAHIHDHLDAGVRPSVVLMNPPFSAAAHVEGRVADAALRHVGSALARLAEGGRLVAITGANLLPGQSGLARRLHPAAGTRPRGVLGRDRRRGLCPARHHHRHPPAP